MNIIYHFIKKCLIIFLLLLLPQLALSIPMQCPDLSQRNHNPLDSNWFVLVGNPQGAHDFIKVRIPYKYAMDMNSVSCFYTEGLIVSQFGSFSRGNINVWHYYTTGGIGGYECSATREECIFY